MHKAAGGALAALLLASPLLLLFLGVAVDDTNNPTWGPTWRSPPYNFLDYARRQPGRLAALAGWGHPPLRIEQAVHDTAETVASIPEAATAAGGSALHSLKAHAEGISLVAKHYALQSFKVLYEACAASLASAKRLSSEGLSAIVRFRGGRRSPIERLFVEGLPKLRSLSGRSYQVVRRTAEGGWEGVKHGPVEGLRAILQTLDAGYLALKSGAQDLGSWVPHPGQLWKGAADFLSLGKLKQRASDLGERGVGVVRQGWEWVGPGGRLHPEEFLERFHGHLVIEAALAIVIGYLFFQQSFKWSTRKNPKQLSEEEIDELCDEWEPEPLHTTLPDNRVSYDTPVVTSATEKFVSVEGIDGDVLNMVTFDFLGASYDPKILDTCKATVSKYGVGACGPRGFYGTIDVHLHLEKRLATFMGQEESIIYAYDLSTIPSVLPAFANAKDLIIVDEAVDYSIQNGCNLSRARIATFRHNDMEDLERVIKSELDKHNALRKPLNRRYIVVEGIYKATGELAPLDAICRLKHAHKFRLVVDESLAFGVLGETGRGACQHFGLQRSDVEIICASMGNALASVGGFCVGDREITDHQRLSGLGYCFSAALPPYLATAAMGALDTLESREGQHLLAKTQQNAGYLRSRLAGLAGFTVVGEAKDAVSPVIHLQLTGSEEQERHEVLQTLQDMADSALKRSHILFAVNKTSALDGVQLSPSIRIVVTAKHNNEDIDDAVAALKTARKAVLGLAEE